MKAAWLIAASLLVPSAWAVVPERGADDLPVRRADFDNIRFLVNEQLRAGARNTEGNVMMTEDSDPMSAIEGAVSAWEAVTDTDLHFAPLQTTSTGYVLGDGKNVILLEDTPEFRSVVGSALAITSYRTLTGSGILESDIIFNPAITGGGSSYTFSTNDAAGTYDFGSVLTHEIGHALGANHTGLTGATMYQSFAPNAGWRGRLSSDDITFLRETYPADGAEFRYGSLGGTVSYRTGEAVGGALVVAVDRSSGFTVGAITDLVTGSYMLTHVPPGSYVVYAEPVDGPVRPANIGLSDSAVDADFIPAFFGGNIFPTEVVVNPGSPTGADIEVERGSSSLNIETFGVSQFGTRTYGTGAELAVPDSTFDVLLFGPGIDGQLTEDNIRILGAGLKVKPGSIRVNQQVVANGYPALYVSVEAGPLDHWEMASVAVTRGTDMAVYSGAIVLTPSENAAVIPSGGIVNAASASAGPVAPDSWVSMYGTGLADGLVVTGEVPLPFQIAGTRVLVYDQKGNERPAALQFVAPGQINLLLPHGTAPGLAIVNVAHDLKESSALLQVSSVAPGLFTANSDGRGAAAAVVLRIHPDGAQSTEFPFSTAEPPGQRRALPIDLGPAGEQVYVSLYGTGIRGFQGAITAQVGGVNVPVIGAAAQGQFAGLDQINIGPLPRTLAGAGEVNVMVSVDGIAANPVRLNVQ